MKKISAVILLTLYIAFSSGVVINLHYCMDRYDSIQLGASKSDICSKCGMHKTATNKCCDDEVKILKLNDDQQVGGINYKFTSPEAVAEIPPVVNSVVFSENNYSALNNNHSPPLSKQDTYLQNCVFRI